MQRASIINKLFFKKDLYGNVKIQNYFVLDYYKQYSQVKLHSPSTSECYNNRFYDTHEIFHHQYRNCELQKLHAHFELSLHNSLHNVIGMRGMRENFRPTCFNLLSIYSTAHVNATPRTSDCLIETGIIFWILSDLIAFVKVITNVMQTMQNFENFNIKYKISFSKFACWFAMTKNVENLSNSVWMLRRSIWGCHCYWRPGDRRHQVKYQQNYEEVKNQRSTQFILKV